MGWYKRKRHQFKAAYEASLIMLGEKSTRRKETRPSTFSGTNTMPGLNDEDTGWLKVGDDLAGLDLGSLSQIRKQSMKKWLKDPYAPNVINTLLYYFVGKDILVTPKTKENERRWRRFVSNNRGWKGKIREFTALGIILGESVVCRSPVSSRSTYGNNTEDKSLRFLGADSLIWMSPSSIKEYVVAVDSETGRGDPKDIVYLIYKDKKDQDVRYHADDFARLSFGDYGILKGRPIFERVLDIMTKYHKYFDAQMAAHMLYANMPLIRKVPSGQQKSRAEDFRKLPPLGSILTVGDDESWERPGMGTQPTGLSITAAISRIAAGVGLPTHTVTSEAGDSGFGQTLSGDLIVHETCSAVRIQTVMPFIERVLYLAFGNFDFDFELVVPQYGKILDKTRAARLGVDAKGLPKSVFSEIFERDATKDRNKIEEESRLSFLESSPNGNGLGKKGEKLSLEEHDAL